MYTEAGKILEKYRKEENIGFRKQAEKLDVSPTYLCDVSNGNRKMTVKLLSKICSVYKYKCTGNDFLAVAKACFPEDVIYRYKLRNHITDDVKVIKDLIYILEDEML